MVRGIDEQVRNLQTDGPGADHGPGFVEDFDRVPAKVEKVGGRIPMPKNAIKRIGLVAVIQDTMGNTNGLLKPE